MNKKVLLIALGAFVLLSGGAAVVAMPKGGGLMTDKRKLSFQASLNVLLKDYATPKGAMTGIGSGVDFCVMTKTKGVEGVKKYCFDVIKSHIVGYNVDDYTWSDFDYRIYDEWLKSGLYDRYLIGEAARGFDWGSFGKMAMGFVANLVVPGSGTVINGVVDTVSSDSNYTA